MRQEYRKFKHTISQLKIGSKILPTSIQVGKQTVGGNNFTVIAGPCAVETKEQIEAIAQSVQHIGAHMLRAGAFKPRTSPYSFQGLGKQGLELLFETKQKYHIPIVTELMDEKQLPLYEGIVDLIQIGSRNMQNFELLKALGKSKSPVLLKRGITATLEEFLLAAEYILDAGNERVILCERGIRSYDKLTRNVLDLSAVAILKQVTRLPVIVDPSHGTGITEIIAPMTLAAKSVGADGIIVEVHDQPENALSDGDQALTPDMFKNLIAKLAA